MRSCDRDHLDEGEDENRGCLHFCTKEQSEQGTFKTVRELRTIC
jgi:hypothetical protein